MKLIAESKGLERLNKIRSRFAAEVRNGYEHNAKPCSACETPGICCRDEHFVNVRITRLEAAAIARRLDELGLDKRDAVMERAASAIAKYDLSEGEDAHMRTFACPLYEAGTGCLVHDSAKPLPCVAHACYENEADLPPSELVGEAEILIADLNRRVYGNHSLPLPIPVAIAGKRKSREAD